MPDRNIQCADCKADFVFTESEAAFFAQKGFTDPKRCKPCRDLKKQSRERQDQQRG